MQSKSLASSFSTEINGTALSVRNESGEEILSLIPDDDGQFATATDGRVQFRCALNHRGFQEHNRSDEKPYCEGRKEPNYFVDRYLTVGGRLSFPNGPYGLLDGGICWWLSRFERNAVMLAVFKPELPQPTSTEAKKIIKDLRSTKKVIEIPGFNNLTEFSTAYKNEIVSSLEAWQLNDGIFSFAWIRGLKGASEVKPEVLQKTMDQTFKLVEEQQRPTFHMLQIKGITAHSWIVLAMDRREDGYDLLVADSNFNDVATWHEYRFGMRQLEFYKSVPYLQKAFNEEADEAVQSGANYCAQSNL